MINGVEGVWPGDINEVGGQVLRGIGYVCINEVGGQVLRGIGYVCINEVGGQVLRGIGYVCINEVGGQVLRGIGYVCINEVGGQVRSGIGYVCMYQWCGRSGVSWDRVCMYVSFIIFIYLRTCRVEDIQVSRSFNDLLLIRRYSRVKNLCFSSMAYNIAALVKLKHQLRPLLMVKSHSTCV